MNWASQYDAAEFLTERLIGHRVVEAEQVNEQEGTLTLDDGTVIEVRANEGCGGCSSGWYSLTCLAAADNIITAVRVTETNNAADRGWSYEDAWTYEVFIYADNTEVNIITVDGDDGNGYYGTGYTLTVREPR